MSRYQALAQVATRLVVPSRCRLALPVGLIVYLTVIGACSPAIAQKSAIPNSAICGIVERTAAQNGLPVDYLSRLLWVESGFNPDAISPAGAAGIAQFMPATAAERGLRDAREPQSAIPHAARLLVDLQHRFGNLALAAAAYNAGPGRVTMWLRGSGGLPEETRRYVRLVTGRPVDEWIARTKSSGQGSGGAQSCTAAIVEFRRTAGLAWRSDWAYFGVPFRVAADGTFLSRSSASQPVGVADRLKIHNLLARAAGMSPGN